MPSGNHLLEVTSVAGESERDPGHDHSDILIWNNGDGSESPDTLEFGDLRAHGQAAHADAVSIEQVSFNFDRIKSEPAATDDVFVEGNIIAAESFDCAHQLLWRRH